MHNTQDHQQGFTLIDLTIYSGLLGILLVILSDIFISVVHLQLSSGSQGAVEQNGTYVLSRLTYDLRRTTQIQSPLIGETVATLSATIRIGAQDVPYTYELQNQNLVMTIGTQTTQINSSDTIITDFSVKKIGNSAQFVTAKDTVQIGFTVHSRGTVSDSRKERSYNTVISLR